MCVHTVFTEAKEGIKPQTQRKTQHILNLLEKSICGGGQEASKQEASKISTDSRSRHCVAQETKCCS